MNFNIAIIKGCYGFTYNFYSDAGTFGLIFVLFAYADIKGAWPVNFSGNKVFKSLPLSKIFFETDEGQRGDIVTVYQKAADILDMSLAELEQQIENNFRALFPKHTLTTQGRSHA